MNLAYPDANVVTEVPAVECALVDTVMGWPFALFFTGLMDIVAAAQEA